MKKTLTMLTVAGAVAALAAPAGAAKPDKAKVPSAEKQCRTERTAMGHETFAQTYGTGSAHKNAFGKCVSKRNAATRAARKAAKGDTAKVAKTVKSQVKADINAAEACQAERTDDAQGFSEKYGTNANKHNAFGKCVSATARESHGSDS